MPELSAQRPDIGAAGMMPPGRVNAFLGDLPTRRHEAWKYTDLKDIAATRDGTGWHVPDDGAATVTAGICPAALESLGRDIETLWIVNGRVQGIEGGDADNPEICAGVRVTDSGLAIAARSAPLHLVFLCDRVHGDEGDAGGVASAPALSLALGEGESLTLIESHLARGDGAGLSLPRLDGTLAAGARLDHYVTNIGADGGYHIAESDLRLAQSALYRNVTLLLGDGLNRREYRVELAGSGAEARLSGACLGRGKAVQDITTRIHHAAPGASSRQNFFSVMDDRARGVFQGKILVSKDAQDTDSAQRHKALLLSPRAEVDAKPELEIYADNVKCAHGVSVGDLDPLQLFYLRQRGIPEPVARQMLIDAFLAHGLADIGDASVETAFQTLLTAHAGGEAA